MLQSDCGKNTYGGQLIYYNIVTNMLYLYCYICLKIVTVTAVDTDRKSLANTNVGTDTDTDLSISILIHDGVSENWHKREAFPLVSVQAVDWQRR